MTAISVAVFLVEKVGRLLNLEYGKDTTAGLICKMMVENLTMSSQTKDVFCIWLVSPLLRKSLHYTPKTFLKNVPGDKYYNNYVSNDSSFRIIF